MLFPPCVIINVLPCTNYHSTTCKCDTDTATINIQDFEIRTQTKNSLFPYEENQNFEVPLYVNNT